MLHVRNLAFCMMGAAVDKGVVAGMPSWKRIDHSAMKCLETHKLVTGLTIHPSHRHVLPFCIYQGESSGRGAPK